MYWEARQKYEGIGSKPRLFDQSTKWKASEEELQQLLFFKSSCGLNQRRKSLPKHKLFTSKAGEKMVTLLLGKSGTRGKNSGQAKFGVDPTCSDLEIGSSRHIAVLGPNLWSRPVVPAKGVGSLKPREGEAAPEVRASLPFPHLATAQALEVQSRQLSHEQRGWA